jgi:hypothetical protein
MERIRSLAGVGFRKRKPTASPKKYSKKFSLNNGRIAAVSPGH